LAGKGHISPPANQIGGVVDTLKRKRKELKDSACLESKTIQWRAKEKLTRGWGKKKCMVVNLNKGGGGGKNRSIKAHNNVLSTQEAIQKKKQEGAGRE